MERAGTSRRDGKDRISSLPDCLIHLIMSFLTAQEAVRTCILSKRWKNLWTSLPFLNFDLSRFEYNDDETNQRGFYQRFHKFLEFVNTTLLLRESSDLHKFRLSCDEMSEFDHEYNVFIRSWILYALKHNIQVFDFDYPLEDPMPLGVFTCASLVDASLNDFLTTANNIYVINLPCLRRLYFTGIILYQDFVDKLFCGCPVLEFLHLEECCREFSKINSQSLKYLKINSGRYCGMIQKRIELIDTPNLQVFDFDYPLEDPMPLGVFTCASLVDASLNGFFTTANNIYVINLPCLRRLYLTGIILYQDFVDKLFCGCPVLEVLHLEECCREFSIINSQSLKYLI